MATVVLSLQYDGAPFFGWQRQSNGETVQGLLEAALSRVADHPITVHCAGRTDTGVHALSQIVHFKTDSTRPPDAWLRGGHTFLPPTIRLQWAKEVPDEFHARFSATARRYLYLLYLGNFLPPFYAGKATLERAPLDVEKMHEGAQKLLGKHNFQSLRASACQSKSPIRTVLRCDVQGKGDWVWLDIEANAFLHHMVRNVMGVLLTIGRGDKPVEWVQEVLAAQDRREGGITAPPDGLYLSEVTYPEQYDLPPSRFSFLPEGVHVLRVGD